MLFHDDIIFIVYMDDGIFLGSNDLQLQDFKMSSRRSRIQASTLKIKATVLIVYVSISRSLKMVPLSSTNEH
jgi:hypothetical protein